QNALDRIWRVPERAKASGLWNLIHTRLLSFGMILGIGFISMVSLLVSAGLSAVAKWRSPWLDYSLSHIITVVNILNALFSFLITTAMFALIYKLMPHTKIHWKDVLIGAVITSILFTVGKLFIGIYIGTSAIASGYGAAGSLLVLLVWVYYSAQVFLMGAEFTWAYSNIYGSRKNK
ncbi:MAG: YihY/virulence factor BrkB family protein, partial [Pseudomonadota bacterium]